MQARCPQCKTSLPYPELSDGCFTCACGRIIHHRTGIYLFVNQDDFYEGRFVTTIGTKGLKKLLKDGLNLISIDGNEDRFYRRATSVIRNELGRRSLEILNIGSWRRSQVSESIGYRHIDRYLAGKPEKRQKCLQGLLSGRLHMSAICRQLFRPGVHITRVGASPARLEGPRHCRNAARPEAQRIFST